MILDSIRLTLNQIGDGRFRRVLFMGVGLALLLLFVAYAIVVFGVQWVTPDSFALPFIGEVTFVDELLSGASLLVMMFLSIFLMVPVASAFTGLFLDDIADAVEEKHYSHLPAARRLGFAENMRETLRFLGVLIGANLLALIAYLIFAPFAPIIFYALNGYLLGREYFFLIAARRLGRDGAKGAFKSNLMTIWAAGALMAVPLTVPLVNLTVPILGVATFTHLYHKLSRA